MGGPTTLLRSLQLFALTLPPFAAFRAVPLAHALEGPERALWVDSSLREPCAVGWAAGGPVLRCGQHERALSAEGLPLAGGTLSYTEGQPKGTTILDRSAAAFTGLRRFDFGPDPSGTIDGARDRVVLPGLPESGTAFHLEVPDGTFSNRPPRWRLHVDRGSVAVRDGGGPEEQADATQELDLGLDFTVQGEGFQLRIRWDRRPVAVARFVGGSLVGYEVEDQDRLVVDRIDAAHPGGDLRWEGREGARTNLALASGEAVAVLGRPGPAGASSKVVPHTRQDGTLSERVARWLSKGFLRDDEGRLLLDAEALDASDRGDRAAAHRLHRWLLEEEVAGRPCLRGSLEGVATAQGGGLSTPARFDGRRRCWVPATPLDPAATIDFQWRAGQSLGMELGDRPSARETGEHGLQVAADPQPAAAEGFALVLAGGPQGVGLSGAWAGTRAAPRWTEDPPSSSPGWIAVREDRWRAAASHRSCSGLEPGPCFVHARFDGSGRGLLAVDLRLPGVLRTATWRGTDLSVDWDSAGEIRLDLPYDGGGGTLALLIERQGPRRFESRTGRAFRREGGTLVGLEPWVAERHAAATLDEEGPPPAPGFVVESPGGPWPFVALDGRGGGTAFYAATAAASDPQWSADPGTSPSAFPSVARTIAVGRRTIRPLPLAPASPPRPGRDRTAADTTQGRDERAAGPTLNLREAGSSFRVVSAEPWVRIDRAGFRSAVDAGADVVLLAGERVVVPQWGLRVRLGSDDRLDLDPVRGAGPDLPFDPLIQGLADGIIQRVPAPSGGDAPPPTLLVLDASSGRILACAHPRAPWEKPDPRHCWGPPVLRPGSTWKIATSIAALGSDDPAVRAMIGGQAPAGYRAGGPRASLAGAWLPAFDGGAPLRLRSRLHNHLGHTTPADADLATALATSSNTWFGYLGLLLDAPTRGRWGDAALADPARLVVERPLSGVARTLGFDQPWPTHWGGPMHTGHFPDAAPDDDSMVAARAVGQDEIRATPLGLGLLVAGTGRDGRFPSPGLGEDHAGARHRLLEPAAASTLDEALRAVIERGTARSAFLGRPSRACARGKTGSAQRIDTQGMERTDAWFVARCEVEGRGSIVAVAVVPGGGLGGAVAAPLVADFFDGWLPNP